MHHHTARSACSVFCSAETPAAALPETPDGLKAAIRPHIRAFRSDVPVHTLILTPRKHLKNMLSKRVCHDVFDDGAESMLGDDCDDMLPPASMFVPAPTRSRFSHYLRSPAPCVFCWYSKSRRSAQPGGEISTIERMSVFESLESLWVSEVNNTSVDELASMVVNRLRSLFRAPNPATSVDMVGDASAVDEAPLPALSELAAPWCTMTKEMVLNHYTQHDSSRIARIASLKSQISAIAEQAECLQKGMYRSATTEPAAFEGVGEVGDATTAQATEQAAPVPPAPVGRAKRPRELDVQRSSHYIKLVETSIKLQAALEKAESRVP